jgi:hypothetical protein
MTRKIFPKFQVRGTKAIGNNNVAQRDAQVKELLEGERNLKEALEKIRSHVPFKFLGLSSLPESVLALSAEWGLSVALEYDWKERVERAERTRDKWAKELDAKEARIVELTTAHASAGQRIAMLEAELQKLRPPEPKFRVGQVVARTPTIHTHLTCKIKAMEHSSKWCSNASKDVGEWWYKDFQDQWAKESDLRALTEEER